ncbi:hypothetical protein DITRI_Ditri15bG0017600 [Diplodiscus trichospermus]
MAETILTIILEVTLSKAIAIVEEQINLQRGFKNELNKLLQSLTMTRAFLKDAETRQVDEPVQVWLKQLRQIAFEAADVLDELTYEDLRRKVETQMRKKVCNFFPISKNPIVFCFKMPQTVKDINISLKEINNQAREYGLQQRVQSLPSLPRWRPSSYSFGDSSQVVGRDADISKIIDLLIGSSTRQTFSIISIVGMAGVGKSALAKSVWDNERTKSYFNKMMWVRISENFDVQKILQEMAESLTGETCDMKNREAVLDKIQRGLDGKTYLLVLDDVWDGDIRAWEDLRGSLLGINQNKRSSILVTSRSENVAAVKDTPAENWHRLMPLKDDECLKIIENRAFQNSLRLSPELKAIGRDIARKCGGVPLVANVIGGTLSNKLDIHEWVSVRDSSLWDSLQKSERFVRVLRLCFDRLPSPSLKQCFVYCSIFPKDFRMQKEQLIQLWMAEGFLQQAEGNFQLKFEDIGNEYFSYLLSSSLLQDVEKDLHGSITSCKMHNLVRDLAQSIRNSETSNTSHHHPQDAFDGVKLWHSLFSKSSFFHIEDFKGLRVLNFCNAEISSLPESIGRLKHLRYFDISHTCIRRLPNSVTQLYHLQTLRLLWCEVLEELPKNMKNLVNLRHLYINSRRHVPDRIGCLTSLQTLPMFVVGTKKGHGIGELGCLSELGGGLKILDLHKVRNKEEVREAKIWEKEKLDKLECMWDAQGEGCGNDEEVLEGLEPRSILKSLTIENYNGEYYPSWMVRKSVSASFQSIYLVELKLLDCKKLKNLPALGLYPTLRFLEIRGLHDVKCIGNEFYYSGDSGDNSKPTTLFPDLEKFTLSDMKVKEWLDAEPKVPMFLSLKELEISFCDNLSSIPVTSTLQRSSLKTLKLGPFSEELEEFPGLSSIHLLHSSLEELTLYGWKKLISLPNQLQHLTALKRLQIQHFSGVKALPEWLGDLSSLRVLNIENCENLGHLPSKEAMQRLSDLQLLSIDACPLLRENRAEQSKISHIPNINIDGMMGFH